MSTISLRALPGLSIQLQLKDPSFDINQFIFVIQDTGVADNCVDTTAGLGHLVVQTEAATMTTGPCLRISLRAETKGISSGGLPAQTDAMISSQSISASIPQSPLEFDADFRNSMLSLHSAPSMNIAGASAFSNEPIDWTNPLDSGDHSSLFQNAADLDFAQHFLSPETRSPSFMSRSESGCSTTPASSRGSPNPPSPECMDEDDDRTEVASSPEEPKVLSKASRGRRSVDGNISKTRDQPKCSFQGCNKTFSRRHDCLRHEVIKHGYQSEWTCRNCGKFFATERSFRRHECPDASGRLQQKWTDRWSRPPNTQIQPSPLLQSDTPSGSFEIVQLDWNAQHGSSTSQTKAQPESERSKQSLNSFLRSCLARLDGVESIPEDLRRQVLELSD